MSPNRENCKYSMNLKAIKLQPNNVNSEKRSLVASTPVMLSTLQRKRNSWRSAWRLANHGNTQSARNKNPNKNCNSNANQTEVEINSNHTSAVKQNRSFSHRPESLGEVEFLCKQTGAGILNQTYHLLLNHFELIRLSIC